MAHKFPLDVWVVWFRDHIHTNEEQQLAVFPFRKYASAWIKRNAIFREDCKLRPLVMVNVITGRTWTKPLIPNRKTIAAMKEARAGKLRKSFKTTKELLADLNRPEKRKVKKK